MLSPEVGGRIVELSVREGDRVTKGQTLMRLAAADYQAQLALQERSLVTSQAAREEACLAAAQARTGVAGVVGLFVLGLLLFPIPHRRLLAGPLLLTAMLSGLPNLLSLVGLLPVGLDLSVGGGVAIPHAFVPDLETPVVGAFNLARSIQYGPTDTDKVKTVFFLVGKEGNPEHHLPILARIARLCSTPEFLDVLGKSRTGRDMFKTILSWDKRISSH